MTSPALAQIPVLVDDRTGAGVATSGLDAELLDRATRDDYDRWLSTALAAGGCVRPIRLRGTVRDIDPATGEGHPRGKSSACAGKTLTLRLRSSTSASRSIDLKGDCALARSRPGLATVISR
jgi:hypothetical protein